ncbi:MAG: glycosyltransferase family 39 protein [Acidobacteria bacterium]|nr:glycosyltransferase family 39 protein [Acidobacteriota bacterium]
MNKGWQKTLETGLGIVLVLLFTVHLGTSAIWDSNEAFYTETPRVMNLRNDYVVPSFNDQPRLNKPPLSYWLVAAAYRVLGVDVWTQRLVGVALLLALFAVVWHFGYDLYAGRIAAWAAVFVVALTPRLLIMGRRAVIEVALLFFITSALWCFHRFRRTGRGRYLFWFYTALAAGFLTKGPVAVILPGLVIVLFLYWQREWRTIREMKPGWGGVWFLLLAAPWFIALGVERGPATVLEFFSLENVARYTSETFGPERGLGFYPGVFMVDFFPWSLLLLSVTGVWWAARRDLSDTERENAAYLVLWCLVPLVFFSLAAGKQEYYLMPVYPAAALLLAGAWPLLQRRLVLPPLLRQGLFVLALVLPALGILMVLVSRRWWSSALWMDLLFIGLWLAISGWAGYRLVRGHSRSVLLAPFLLCVTIVTYVLLVVLPGIEAFRPIPRLAERLVRTAPPPARYGTYNLAAPSLCFYTRQPVLELKTATGLVAMFTRYKPFYCLMPEEGLAALEAQGLPYEELAREPVFPVKLTHMLTFDAEHPRRTLVLVRNAPPATDGD